VIRNVLSDRHMRQNERNKSDRTCLFKNAHILAICRLGTDESVFIEFEFGCSLGSAAAPVYLLKPVFDCFLVLQTDRLIQPELEDCSRWNLTPERAIRSLRPSVAPAGSLCRIARQSQSRSH
jgi:hypothetical protein